jgi:hypothetical protein
MFLSEHVSGIADSRMTLEIYFPILDCFTYCILSDIEVAKILDGCGLGPIYTSLVVIEYRGWIISVVHFEVAEDMSNF